MYTHMHICTNILSLCLSCSHPASIVRSHTLSSIHEYLNTCVGGVCRHPVVKNSDWIWRFHATRQHNGCVCIRHLCGPCAHLLDNANQNVYCGCQPVISGENKRTIGRPQVIELIISQFINRLSNRGLIQKIWPAVHFVLWVLPVAHFVSLKTRPAAHFFHFFFKTAMHLIWSFLLCLPIHWWWKWFELQYWMITMIQFVPNSKYESVK